jgi:hypothetical protein
VLQLSTTPWRRIGGVKVQTGTDPRILDLGTRWRWVVSFTPRPLYSHGKSPWYLLDRKLGGPQSRSGRGQKKNLQPLPGLEPPSSIQYWVRYLMKRSREFSLVLFESTCRIRPADLPQDLRDWSGDLNTVREKSSTCLRINAIMSYRKVTWMANLMLPPTLSPA